MRMPSFRKIRIYCTTGNVKKHELFMNKIRLPSHADKILVKIRKTQYTNDKGGDTMCEEFIRTARLIGIDGVQTLQSATVAVFGIGGVGSYAVEALARSGIGTLILVDNDVVSVSNINRQLPALHSTVGQYKTQVMAQRIHDICPDTAVITHEVFYLPETADMIDLSICDYIVDAIDTVSAKVELAMRAKTLGIPLISSMGTGNKLDPTKLVITDIYKTNTCPLARVMRRELRTRGVDTLKVVYSTEPAITPIDTDGTASRVPASISFVPSVAGLLAAGEVIKDILEKKR